VLVSIVMAAYNAEATIGEAIASVLAQTHGDWELLVVDDGSTDATQALALAAGDERIRVLQAPHAGLLAQVRNRGIQEARGDAIALLDADDVWLRGKLARQVGILLDRPTVGIVHTAAALLVDGARRDAPRAPEGPVFANLLENNFIYSSSVLVRRSIIDRHGAFDPDPVLGGSPDYDLWLRLAPRTEFAFVEEPLLLYRVHGDQMSTDERAMNRSALQALERARRRDPELVARDFASFRLGVGKRRYLAGAPGRGRRDLLSAIVRRPGRRRGWTWLLRALRPRSERVR
jgi:glycosyltransferase involved in cell wall biosynthesis